MPHPPALYHWIDTVSTPFPHLSKPLATGLALWSFGMSMARSCGLSAVARCLAPLLGQSCNTGRERRRDPYREAAAKAGADRAHLELRAGWAPWREWVLAGWGGRHLAIALDATTLGQRVVVLAISVGSRGGAVPVAWQLLPATDKHPWQPEWLALLKHFHAVVPSGWTVMVLADRGLYAKGLFDALVAVGGPPLLRSNQPGQCRPQGGYPGVPFPTLVPVVGRRGQGRGTAFTGKDTPLDCPRWGSWGSGYQEPGVVLTELSPQAAAACWYGLRAWREHGFKRRKSGGWQWQYTRMTAPARAERRWLARALATWWVLSVGGAAEAERPAATLPPVPATARRQGRHWRLVGIFRRGWNLILAALLNQQPVLPGRGSPEPWPTLPPLQQSGLPDPDSTNEKNLHL